MNERLTRSQDDRMLAGVAGGLAELWDADPTLVRLAWVLLAVVTGGIALIPYIVMAIVVPEAEPQSWTVNATGPQESAMASGPGVGAGPAQAGWVPLDSGAARRAARAARRAERRARGGSGLAVVLGGLLVILGAVLLVREWLPQVDLDWLGPTLVIGLGVLLLVMAFGRGQDSGRPSTGAPTSDPGRVGCVGSPARAPQAE